MFSWKTYSNLKVQTKVCISEFPFQEIKNYNYYYVEYLGQITDVMLSQYLSKAGTALLWQVKLYRNIKCKQRNKAMVS